MPDPAAAFAHEALNLPRDGAHLFHGAATADLPQLRAIMHELPVDQAGVRIHDFAAIRAWLAPPFNLLARMITLRVHLDDVPAGSVPLPIAPGSHRHGRVPVNDVERVVAACGTMACLAKAGDVWAYATPILHASDAAANPARRRVLQVDFSADPLPGGLEWLGV